MKAPQPKRSRSYLEAPVAIISIAQQARPKVIGHKEFFRPQFRKSSKVVRTTPSCMKRLRFNEKNRYLIFTRKGCFRQRNGQRFQIFRKNFGRNKSGLLRAATV